MSAILLILLVVFAILALTNSRAKEVPKVCKPHKWVWEKQPGEEDVEYLRCSNCNKLPSEAVNE
jgi:hypothetical protein